jgi:shikimate 5-dehydrogenase
MQVGIIGLGRMGGAIAGRLIEAGHQVKVYNRTRSRAEALKADGAVIADSPVEASAGEAVITMLADNPAVEATRADAGGEPAARPLHQHYRARRGGAGLVRTGARGRRKCGPLKWRALRRTPAT